MNGLKAPLILLHPFLFEDAPSLARFEHVLLPTTCLRIYPQSLFFFETQHKVCSLCITQNKIGHFTFLQQVPPHSNNLPPEEQKQVLLRKSQVQTKEYCTRKISLAKVEKSVWEDFHRPIKWVKLSAVVLGHPRLAESRAVAF